MYTSRNIEAVQSKLRHLEPKTCYTSGGSTGLILRLRVSKILTYNLFFYILNTFVKACQGRSWSSSMLKSQFKYYGKYEA